MSDLETRVRNTAERLQRRLEGAPEVFRPETWPGRAIAACLESEPFRIALFRFIDVLPSLPDLPAVAAHVQEYFSPPGPAFPEAARLGLAGPMPGRVRAADAETARRRIAELSRVFILGETIEEALPALAGLRARGLAVSADALGEAVVSEAEAEEHIGRYRALLAALEGARASWTPLAAGGAGGGLDWGRAPMVNVSVKPSALYSQMRPEAFDHSVGRAAERLRPLLRQAAGMQAHLILDMEQTELKNITLAIFRTLLSEPEFRDYPHAGIIIQSYRRDSEEDLRGLLEWARARGERFTVRLVKGAYREAEAARAVQNNWPLPVFDHKEQTDANFEKLARLLLEGRDRVDPACASHNLRSIAFFLETARDFAVPRERLEFQTLYGMAEPVEEALREEGLPVRVYAPMGPPIPGLAYLIRRLLEITSPDAFLAGLYRPGPPVGPPAAAVPASSAAPAAAAPAGQKAGLPGGEAGLFRNEPPRDWTLEEDRRRFAAALIAVRRRLPESLPLVIGGKEVETEGRIRSDNPNRPEELVALSASAGKEQALAAVEAARRAFPAWRETGPRERTGFLFRAAAAARRMRDELAALQVLEAGKSWREADADVCESIDYLEYYGRQMLDLAAPRPTAALPGEESGLVYEPRGVAAVIAPWNFPMAISTGMVCAALAAGNTVVYKPSSYSPAAGFAIHRVFREAGLPDGVLNYLPGSGGEIGELLTSHPEVALVAFTGSKEVGLRILDLAHRAASRQVRGVIAELGGKNAIIVDEDADLDEVVLHTLQSAFGYQGQKCSACSRLIVLDRVHDRVARRLKEALSGIELGPAEDPKNLVGAVISETARRRILFYIETGRREAELLARREPPPGPGYTVPPAIFTGVRPEHRIAREEIFGPVLAVLRADSLEEALRMAGDSEYALTGGLFSRSPAGIERVRRSFRVGNLYINRGITGALVARHPFGGFMMSGTGSKAGGPDYLLHFLHARTVTENTLRRGFYPPPGGQGVGSFDWRRERSASR